jgi:hypothetical protein
MHVHPRISFDIALSFLPSTVVLYYSNLELVRLAGSQPASSAFLSHQFSISHQPSASQQYFSLTINQPQPPAISQPNEALISWQTTSNSCRGISWTISSSSSQCVGQYK